MPKVEDNPIKNEPTININVTEPKAKLTSNEEAALNFNSNFGTNPVIDIKPEINLNDDNFDPVNLIDTLDLAYHTKVEEKWE